MPDARVAGWFAASGAPFAIEAVRRTPSDRKGGHFARRKSDGRIVLRETAQTLARGPEALGRPRPAPVLLDQQPVVRPRARCSEALDARDGVLGLPLIRNIKTVDPADPSTPEVIQIETAMGAAIEVFEGSRTIEVGRDRFVPVKTTNDLLVLRSDVYDIGERLRARPGGRRDPVRRARPATSTSWSASSTSASPRARRRCARRTSLTVEGDWTFGHGVRGRGRGRARQAEVRPAGRRPGAVLGADD